MGWPGTRRLAPISLHNPQNPVTGTAGSGAERRAGLPPGSATDADLAELLAEQLSCWQNA